jgi:hypothetical protein
LQVAGVSLFNYVQDPVGTLMQDRPLQSDPSFRRQISHPMLRELYDYWQRHRGAGAFMPREKLDPVEIPLLLKNLILADVADGGHTISYRLVGTEIVIAHGMDYTGKSVEELTDGTTLAFTRNLYSMIVCQSVPVFSQGRFRWAGKEHCWTKRLHLPLSRSGTAVDMVLVGQIFESVEAGNQEQLLPARPEDLAADQTAPPTAR